MTLTFWDSLRFWWSPVPCWWYNTRKPILSLIFESTTLLLLMILTVELRMSPVPKENSEKCPRFSFQSSSHLIADSVSYIQEMTVLACDGLMEVISPKLLTWKSMSSFSCRNKAEDQILIVMDHKPDLH